MKFFTRVLVLFVLSLGMVAVAGCGVDNEEEGKKLAKQAGDPGAPNPKGVPTATQPAPTTEAERGQRMLDAQKNVPKGYPSGKK